jgi:hypothetical protein
MKAAARDVQHVFVLAFVSLALALALEAVYLLVPSARAPRINVRWVDGINDAARQDAEARLHLAEGERREGTTWAYDVADPTEEGVRALLSDPSVADTHSIDRARATIARDAPRGTTLIMRGPVAALRESAVFTPLRMFLAATTLISAIWLLSHGARRQGA